MSAADCDLNTILRGYLREVLAADLEQRRITPPGQPVFTGDRPGLDYTAVDLDLDVLGDLLDDARGALAARDTRLVTDQVSELIARHGMPEAVRHRLSLGVLEARVRYIEEATRRTRGLASTWLLAEEPALASVASQPAADAPLPLKPLAPALVAPFFARREERDRATHQVMGQERGTLRRFMKVCGDRPVDTYHRGDVTGFLDTLRRLPATYGKSPKDKDRPLQDLIAEADAKGTDRLTDKTVKRHLSALSQFFQFALDSGHLSNAQRGELVDKHRFRQQRGARDQRDAWAPEELAALFRSSVWTGCHGKARRSEPGPHII
jgi:hypothetical protein